MNIALMCHDHKKELMVQFCLAYSAVLARHNICATATLYLSHEHGGSQQIGARITYNEIDMVLFFSEPQSHDLDEDLDYVMRLCDQYNIPVATNLATAEMLILGLSRGDLDWRDAIKPGSAPFLS